MKATERLALGLKPADLGVTTRAEMVALIAAVYADQQARDGDPTDRQMLAGAEAELIRIRLKVLTGKRDELGADGSKLKWDYAARVAALNRELAAAEADAGLVAAAAPVTSSVVKRFTGTVVLPEAT